MTADLIDRYNPHKRAAELDLSGSTICQTSVVSGRIIRVLCGSDSDGYQFRHIDTLARQAYADANRDRPMHDARDIELPEQVARWDQTAEAIRWADQAGLDYRQGSMRLHSLHTVVSLLRGQAVELLDVPIRDVRRTDT